jgi:glyoxylase I family protein
VITYHSLQHVSLAVTNLEVARTFYREVLELPEIKRPDFHTAGAWFQVGAQQLHLIEYPRGQTLRASRNIDSDDGHFALRIDDYEAAMAHLEASGVPYQCNPLNKAGWSQIYLCDPDGHIIELSVIPE